MTMGKRMQHFRKIQKMSMKELSARAKISRTTLWQYEADVRTPSITIAQQIANALAIPVGSLIDDNEDTLDAAKLWVERVSDAVKNDPEKEKFILSNNFELYVLGGLQNLPKMDILMLDRTLRIIDIFLSQPFNDTTLTSINIILGCLTKMNKEGIDKVQAYAEDIYPNQEYRKPKHHDDDESPDS